MHILENKAMKGSASHFCNLFVMWQIIPTVHPMGYRKLRPPLEFGPTLIILQNNKWEIWTTLDLSSISQNMA